MLKLSAFFGHSFSIVFFGGHSFSIVLKLALDLNLPLRCRTIILYGLEIGINNMPKPAHAQLGHAVGRLFSSAECRVQKLKGCIVTHGFV